MELRPDHQFDPFAPGADAYDEEADDVVNSIDWNDPSSFFKAIGAGTGGLPMPDIKSAPDVRREATTRSTKIYESYELLHEILQRHEATIRKRWLKKTRPQRLKILLNVWPNMPAMHRPDFEAFRKESEADRDRATKYRDYYLWPYINQEDLLNTKTLPLLLNARGRHPPSHFAAADIGAMRLGLVSKAVVPIFLNQYVMMFNGMTENTLEYGKLVGWDEHPDAFDWMHTQKQFIPGEGLLVLEVQERLLNALVQCCLQLLHDIPESHLTSDSFPILPEPALKPESEITGFESLGIMATEAPYRVPAQLDLRLIESLLSARASAAEDHLWALREDPDYFQRTVLDAQDHRQEMLKDTMGRNHPVFSHGQRDVLWARVLGSVVLEAYINLELFSELSSQARNLASMQEKYAGDISPSKDLPEEYLEALLRFQFFVNQTAKGPLGTLKFTAVASPPLRRLFVREPPLDYQSPRIQVILKPGVKMDKKEEQLIWLLRTLWEDGHGLFLASMPLVVDEIERLIQSEPFARELLSSKITATIGDLSILSQCLNQLSLYHPWARSFESDSVDREESFKKDYAERTQSWAKIIAATHEKSISSRAVALGQPTGGRFNYPVDKRRTRENVEALRKAEANLDAFWVSIDHVIIAKAGELRDSAVRNLLSQPRILRRTREWVEPEGPPVPAQHEEIDLDPYTSYQPISKFYVPPSPKDLDVQKSKTKVKTRGKARPPTPPTEAEVLTQPNPVDPQPSFPVDARALKVFRTVFHNPAATSTPGEIPWNDFLHAMTSVGFTVMKLYGSVWQFQPTKLDVERNIQFHEPHPRGKLPFTTARQYGRRLNRAYGWFGRMFVLADKAGK